MKKESWFALIIASVLTILVAMPLYYSRAKTESMEKISEGSDTKVKKPMQRMGNKAESEN